MEIRTRIAPSPTGDPHLGTAYIALFNLAFAKKQGGKFILRIEDTDRVRSTRESETAILNSLKWLGINWDEGPDIGGEFGPYRQSERKEIYQKYAKQLVGEGKAFHCFCSSHRLDEVRKEQQAKGETPKYDGFCLNLSKEEVAEKLAKGEESVIRMKVPESGICVVSDMLRGEIEIPWDRIDMQVLLKADGWPTYFLANVIDDHLMNITHVLRGEEWLPSAPKILKLYEYFNFPLPKLFYMPLLRNADKSKLSKRKNPTSILFYKQQGFLPEAVLNYLGRMGYSLPNEAEKFNLTEMIDGFDINRISLGGPIFDIEKLSWLNGLYLRSLPTNEFLEKLTQWKFNQNFVEQIIPLAKERVNTFAELPDLTAFFFTNKVELNKELLTTQNLDELQTRKFLQLLLWKLENLRVWNKDLILEEIKGVAGILEIKFKFVMPIIFASITGKTSSVSVLDAMEILGSDLSRFRLKQALDFLGSTSKKEVKEWEKLI